MKEKNICFVQKMVRRLLEALTIIKDQIQLNCERTNVSDFNILAQKRRDSKITFEYKNEIAENSFQKYFHELMMVSRNRSFDCFVSTIELGNKVNSLLKQRHRLLFMKSYFFCIQSS